MLTNYELQQATSCNSTYPSSGDCNGLTITAGDANHCLFCQALFEVRRKLSKLVVQLLHRKTTTIFSHLHKQRHAFLSRPKQRWIIFIISNVYTLHYKDCHESTCRENRHQRSPRCKPGQSPWTLRCGCLRKRFRSRSCFYTCTYKDHIIISRMYRRYIPLMYAHKRYINNCKEMQDISSIAVSTLRSARLSDIWPWDLRLPPYREPAGHNHPTQRLKLLRILGGIGLRGCSRDPRNPEMQRIVKRSHAQEYFLKVTNAIFACLLDRR